MREATTASGQVVLRQAHPQSGFGGFLGSSQGGVEAKDALLRLHLLCCCLCSAQQLLHLCTSRLRLIAAATASHFIKSYVKFHSSYLFIVL